MLSSTRDYDVVAGFKIRCIAAAKVSTHGWWKRWNPRGLVMTYRVRSMPRFPPLRGITEDAGGVWSKDLPYLKGVECPFDIESPYYQWKVSLKIGTLEKNLRQQKFAVGTISAITPLAYSRAGRVATLRIIALERELTIRGEDLRKAVGYAVIPSTQFAVRAGGHHLRLRRRSRGRSLPVGCRAGRVRLFVFEHSYTTILTELRDASLTQAPPVPSGPSS